MKVATREWQRNDISPQELQTHSKSIKNLNDASSNIASPLSPFKQDPSPPSLIKLSKIFQRDLISALIDSSDVSVLQRKNIGLTKDNLQDKIPKANAYKMNPRTRLSYQHVSDSFGMRNVMNWKLNGSSPKRKAKIESDKMLSPFHSKKNSNTSTAQFANTFRKHESPIAIKNVEEEKEQVQLFKNDIIFEETSKTSFLSRSRGLGSIGKLTRNGVLQRPSQKQSQNSGIMSIATFSQTNLQHQDEKKELSSEENKKIEEQRQQQITQQIKELSEKIKLDNVVLFDRINDLKKLRTLRKNHQAHTTQTSPLSNKQQQDLSLLSSFINPETSNIQIIDSINLSSTQIHRKQKKLDLQNFERSQNTSNRSQQKIHQLQSPSSIEKAQRLLNLEHQGTYQLSQFNETMLSMRSALSMSDQSFSPKHKEQESKPLGMMNMKQMKLHQELIKRISWKNGSQPPYGNAMRRSKLDQIKEAPFAFQKQMNSTFQIPRLQLSPMRSSLPVSLIRQNNKIASAEGMDNLIGVLDLKGSKNKRERIDANKQNYEQDEQSLTSKTQFFSRRTQQQRHRRQLSNQSAQIDSPKNNTTQMNKTFSNNLLSKNQRLLFSSHYGRTHHFSQGFNQIMYKDNGIGSSLMENERKIKSLIKYKEKEERRLRIQQEQNTKRTIAMEYLEKYKILLSPKEFKSHSENQLEMLLRERLNSKLMSQAAIVIQKFWRQSQQRKSVRAIVRQKTKAAVRIQNFWKKVKIISLLPRTLKLRKNLASIKVQKYLKGFMTRRKVAEDLRIFRLHTHFKFFSCLKSKIEHEMAIKMQSTWRMYQAKQERQYLLELKIKQEQAKKYATKKKQVSQKNNHANNQMTSSGQNVPPLKMDKKNLGVNNLTGSYKKTTQGLVVQRALANSSTQSSHAQISRQTSKVRDLYPDKSTENDSQKQTSQRGTRKNSQTRIIVNSVSPQQNKQPYPQVGSTKVIKQQANLANEEYAKQFRTANHSGLLSYDASGGLNERGKIDSQQFGDETPQGSTKSRLLSFEQATNKQQLDEISDDKSFNGGGTYQDQGNHNQILLEQLDDLLLKEGMKPKILLNGGTASGVGASNYAAKLGALDKIKEESISPTQSQKRIKASQFKNLANTGSKSYVVESASKGSMEIEVQDYDQEDQPISEENQEIRNYSSQLGISHSVQRKQVKDSINLDSARSNQNFSNDKAKKASSFLKVNQPLKANQNSIQSSSQSLNYGQVKPSNLSRFNLKTPAVKSDRRILDKQIILGVKDQANRELQNLRQKREEFGIFNMKKISSSGLKALQGQDGSDMNALATARFIGKNLNASQSKDGYSENTPPMSATYFQKRAQEGLNTTKNQLDPSSGLLVFRNPFPSQRSNLSYQRSQSSKRSMPKEGEDDNQEQDQESEEGEEEEDDEEEMLQEDEPATTKSRGPKGNDQDFSKHMGGNQSSKLKPKGLSQIQKKLKSYNPGANISLGLGGLASPQMKGRGIGGAIGGKLSVNSKPGFLGVQASPLQRKRPDDSPAARSNLSKKSPRVVKNNVKTEKLSKHFTLGKKQNTLAGEKSEEEGAGQKNKKRSTKRHKSSSETSQKDLEEDDYGEKQHFLHEENEDEQLISSPDGEESSPDFKQNKSTLQKPAQVASNVRRISQSRNKILQLERIGNKTESPAFRQASIKISPASQTNNTKGKPNGITIEQSEKQNIENFTPSSSMKIPLGSLGSQSRTKEDLISFDEEENAQKLI